MMKIKYKQIGLVAIGFGALGLLTLVLTHAATGVSSIETEAGVRASGSSLVTDSTASGGQAIKFGSAASTIGCSISATLVNSCRPWLGAAVLGYPGASGFAASMANHESRIGRSLDIVHDYRNPGQVLSADDVTLAKRANTILLMNWKPAFAWSDAGGGNSTTNSQIDTMADSIKALGSTKIMVSVFHEPENDVSPGGDAACPNVAYKGGAGTVTDYVNMWHNVRARFNAKGVTNVVWAMNYMGFATWDCLVPDLWPGNSYVDWVLWDPYNFNSSDFTAMTTRFYDKLTALSDTTHNYLSKPWGLNEWGDLNVTNPSTAYSFYDNAKADLDANRFPKLKAYLIWDTLANGDEGRVQYNASGILDQIEQDHYNTFAQDPRFTNSFY